MKVLFLSHTAKGGVFRVGSHHLSEALVRLGHEVRHASTPVTPLHLARLSDPEVRRRLGMALRPARLDEAGVLVDVPWTWTRSGSVRQPGRWDIAFVDQPLFASALERLDVGRVVYRPTDPHPDGRLHLCERDVVNRCAGVVATSSAVLASLGDLAVPTLVLENGVDLAHFRRESGLRAGAVYVGAVDHRFDVQLIQALAESQPGVPISVFGATGPPSVPLPSSVVWAPPVDYRDLPRHLSSSRVGLLPFNDHPANASRSPMKYYEYLASSLYVLGRRTPTLARRAAAEGVVLYDVVSQAVESFADLVSREGPYRQGPEIAKDFDWDSRARELMAFAAGLP